MSSRKRGLPDGFILSSRNWEKVSDLQMENRAPIEAAHAYRNGGVRVGERKAPYNLNSISQKLYDPYQK